MVDNERDLRIEFHSALDAVLPPAPWLEATVKRELRQKLPKRRRPDRTSRRLPRVSQQVAAALLLLVLAATAIGVFLVARGALTSVPAGPPSTIVPDKMVSPTIGWAGGPRHAVLRTTDGGIHWTEMHPIRSPGFEVSWYFLDTNHAWITDTPGSVAGGWTPGLPATAYQLRTYRTTNGGRTWQQGTPVRVQTLPGFYGGLVPDLFFVDSSHGWLLSRTANAIYSTNDGGLHWQESSSNPSGTAPDCQVDQISFASAAIGWLTSSCGAGQNLWVTHDGGVSWRVQALPFKASNIRGLDVPVFFDSMHGELLVAVGEFNPPQLLFVSSDGGATWSPRSLPGASRLSVDFVDASHGWVTAGHESDLGNGPVWDSMQLYHTDDGGLNWTAMQTDLVIQEPKGLITELMFVDQENGFATRAPSCLFSQDCSRGPSEFLKTTDGGHTWTVVWADG